MVVWFFELVRVFLVGISQIEFPIAPVSGARRQDAFLKNLSPLWIAGNEAVSRFVEQTIRFPPITERPSAPPEFRIFCSFTQKVSKEQELLIFKFFAIFHWFNPQWAKDSTEMVSLVRGITRSTLIHSNSNHKDIVLPRWALLLSLVKFPSGKDWKNWFLSHFLASILIEWCRRLW